MKYIPIIILWAWAITAAYADTIQAHITLGIVDIGQMTNAGAVTPQSEPPVQCDVAADGTICDY